MISLFDLVKAFNEVLDRAKSRPTYHVENEEVTVRRHGPALAVRCWHDSNRTSRCSSCRLIEKQHTRRAMICLFLAILEMVKLHAVELVQKELFDEIALKRGEGFDTVFSGAQPSIEEEYK